MKNMTYKASPRHTQSRNVLRVLGLMGLLIGISLVMVRFASFFRAFGSFGTPKYFWCAFIGFPIIALGLVLLKMGFLGVAAAYVSDEVAPVLGKAAGYIGSEVAAGIHSTESAAIRMEHLKALKDKGLITEAEYHSKRDAVLRDL